MTIKHYLSRFAALLIVVAALPAGAQSIAVEYLSKGTWFALSDANVSKPNGFNTLSFATPDFLSASSTATRRVRIRNLLDVGLTLGVNPVNTDEFTRLGTFPTSLQGGATREFDIEYDPLKPSALETFNIGGPSQLGFPFTFYMTGSVIDSIGLMANTDSPSEIILHEATSDTGRGTDFGELNVGGGGIPQETATSNFRLANLASASGPLVYSDAKVTGAGSGDFEIIGLPAEDFLTADKVQDFQIRFNPSAVGLRTATFSIQTTDMDFGDEGLFSFELSGRGAGTTMVKLEGKPGIALDSAYLEIMSGDVSPRIPDGTQMVATTPGEMRSSKFRVTNTGSVSITLDNVKLTTTSGPEAFTLSPTGDFSMSPGETQIFNLDYDPSDACMTNANINFLLNGISRDLRSFNISGTADGPEMQFYFQPNGASTGRILADGSNTPSDASGSIFSANIGGSQTRSFIIRNIGNEDLDISNMFIQGLDGPWSLEGLSSGVSYTLSPSESETFQIKYSPTNSSVSNKVFEMRNNDFNEGPITMNLRGNPVGTPELRVRGLEDFGLAFVATDIDDTPLIPDQTVTTFPDADSLNTTTRSFRLRNDGSDDLILSNITSDNPAFTVEGVTFPVNVGPDGATRDFNMLFSPTMSGEDQQAIISVSHNAENLPNPFRFAVKGSSFQSDLLVFGGLNLDQIIEPGSGSVSENNGTLFPVLPVNGEPVTRTYLVQNNGNVDYEGSYLSDVLGNQQENFSPSISTDFTVPAGGTEIISINFHPVQVGEIETRVAISPRGDSIGSHQLRLIGYGEDPNAAPNLRVAAGVSNTEIASGATASVSVGTDFGNVPLGEIRTLQVTVENDVVQGVLSIQNVLIQEVNGGGFNFIEAPAGVDLAPGESKTFQIRFDAEFSGEIERTVVISTNDPTNQSFLIQVRGNVPAAPQTTGELTVLGGPDLEKILESGVHDVNEANGTLYPEVELGSEPVTRTFLIKNAGASVYKGSYLTDAPGNDQRHFSVGEPSQLNIPAGGSVSITVNFHPVVTGGLETRLIIKPDDGFIGSYEITLIGSGVAAQPPVSDVVPEILKIKRLGDSNNYELTYIGPAGQRYSLVRSSDEDLLSGKFIQAGVVRLFTGSIETHTLSWGSSVALFRLELE